MNNVIRFPNIKTGPGILVPGFAPGFPRFARLAHEVWRSFPLSDRRKMLAHWRKRNGSPDMLYARNLKDCFDVDNECFALCREQGHNLAFLGPLIRHMPDRIAKIVIAHELAHVCTKAWGWEPESRAKEYANGGWDYVLDGEEGNAGMICNDWGYDMGLADKWVQRWFRRNRGKKINR